MKISRLITSLVCMFTCVINVNANGPYPIEQLYSDISHKQNLDKAIPWLENELEKIDTNNYIELQYVLYVGLLTQGYIIIDKMGDAARVAKTGISFLKNKNPNSSYLFFLYHNYASVLSQFSNYELALEYITKAVELADKNQVNYYSLLDSLAITYFRNKKYKEACETIEKCLKLVDSDLMSIPDKINCLITASHIYPKLGQTDIGFSLIKKADDLCKAHKELTEENNKVTLRLAEIYSDMGKYEESNELLRYLEKNIFPQTESIRNSHMLCMNYYLLNDQKKFSEYAIKTSQYIKDELLKRLSSSPTSLTQYQWRESAIQLTTLNSFLETMNDNVNYLSLCYDNAIFRKNLQYNLSKELKKQLYTNRDLKNKYNSIKNLKSDIFGNLNKADKLEELQIKELQLGSIISDSLQKKTEFKRWKDIRNSLEQEDIAIEIITYTPTTQDAKTYSLKYGALLLLKDTQYPIFVEIGDFSYFAGVMQNALNGNYEINKFYAKENSFIYDFFWSKISPFLKGIKKIYISPSYGFQNVNFGFIRDPDGHFLNEKYEIQHVISTSNIKSRFDTKAIKEATIYGGIDYSNETKAEEKDSYRSIVLGSIGDSTRGQFNYLEGTISEMNKISSILSSNNVKCSVKNASDASEESFRRLDGKSCHLIHIASHAFYLVGSDKYKTYFNKLTTQYETDNTMMLSGLVFSNANNAINSQQDIMISNDGIMTSEEIALMDLSKTEMVVLSACNTGRGFSSDGYGGLVKAFKMAGVKYLIVSIWSVSDLSTSYLMERFYAYIFSGVEIHKALEKAQLDTSKLYPDPYYWAGFMIIN